MHAAEAHDARVRRWALIVIVISLGLRVWGLDAQSIWRDEADSLAVANSPAQLRSMLTTPGHNAPLYYLLLRGWQGLAGSSLLAARLFSALWGVLAVALTYAVGRRLFSARLGALAALCAGLSPYLVWYSQEARTYAPLLAFSLLSFWLFLRALQERKTGLWALWALCSGLCLYLHLLTALLIVAQAAIGVLWRLRGHRLPWTAALALAGVLLAGAPLWIWEARLLLNPLPSGYAPAAPGQMIAGLSLAFTTGASGRLPLILAAPGLFLALAGVVLPPSERGVWVVLLWLLIPLMGLALIAAVTPLFNERYLIYLAPAWYLLTARGVLAFGSRSKALAGAALGALLLVNAAGLWVQYTQTIKPDFRGAAAVYAAQRQSDDGVLFLIPQAQVVFEQWLPADRARYLSAPFANRPADQIRLDRRMRALLGDSRRIWLLESEPALWDRQGLVAGWLERHGERSLRVDLHLVTLSLYVDIDAQRKDALTPVEYYLPLMLRVSKR